MNRSAILNSLAQELELILNASLEDDKKYAELVRFFYRAIHALSAAEQIVFRNFYARYRFLADGLGDETAFRRNLDAFRRFIRTGTGRGHEGVHHKQAAGLLVKFLNLLEGDALLVGYADEGYVQDYFTRFVPIVDYAKRKDLRMICMEWGPSEDRSTFSLRGYDLLNMEGEVEIVWAIGGTPDFSYLAGLLRKEMIIYGRNLKPATLSGRPSYQAAFGSTLTVEPDFLVDATAIGECFSVPNPSSKNYLLVQMIKGPSGESALMGTIAGKVLDELVRDHEQDFDVIYDRAMQENALRSAQFGSSSMERIREKIRSVHLGKIRKLVDKVKEENPWIEPTYFSDVYGIQGRIDLLLKAEASDAHSIVELKSGNPPPLTRVAWENHLMQVVCYDMLLDSTYGSNSSGSKLLYYAADNVLPSRAIVAESAEHLKALQVRNAIIQAIYSISENDFSLLEGMAKEALSVPPFAVDNLNEFRRHYQSGTVRSIYYCEMVAFVLRELINAKVGGKGDSEQDQGRNGFASLWLDAPSRKAEAGLGLYGLTLAKVDKVLGMISFRINNAEVHSFREGDPVIIYPDTGDSRSVLKSHILKGYLKQCNSRTAVVSLANRQSNYEFIERHPDWAIEPDIYEQNFWSIVGSLFNFLKAPEERGRLLLGLVEPRTSSVALFGNSSLTSCQRQTLSDALFAHNYYLLQGPPGTGKTSTWLVNYIREVLGHTRKRLVVLAFTNKAVEKISENFRRPRDGEEIEYVRIGSRSTSDPRSLTELMPDGEPDQWREALKNTRVILSTVATFQNNFSLLGQFLSFDEVIVDEASQLSEAGLVGVLSAFEKFVLIGDHKQLPAVITQDDQGCQVKDGRLHQFGLLNHRVSLFERLFRLAQSKGWFHAYGQLEEHYRMHADIAYLIQHNYRGLSAQKSHQRLPWWEHLLNAESVGVLPRGHILGEINKSRIIFIETPADPAPKTNRAEARLASFIVRALVEAGSANVGEIGIIAPFRAQIGEIRRELPIHYLEPGVDGNVMEEHSALVVDTVERFQGDEREVIVFSTTAAKPIQVQRMQSISDAAPGPTDRKLLVTISRAKTKLIILGNSEALESSEHYAEVLRRIRETGGYISRNWAESILRGYEYE